MASGKEPKDELSPAEAAFVEFLAGQDIDPPISFESFLAGHPSLDGELRRLHDDWVSIARVLRRGRDEGTPRGEPALEELHIEPEGQELQLEFAGDLVRRLARDRTPPHRYESRGEIARGGMGVIYKVWDPHLRRQLAMKVILARRDVASPEERSRAMHRALARFLEEAQVTSQLDHPGIVPVHDVGIDGSGRVYFTMRLVRGRDFRHILELVKRGEEGWTRARALGVVLKVCEAVAFAHSKGVIHRDLKPANVMVGRFGEVYVMDWGLARVLRSRDSKDSQDRRPSSDTNLGTRVDTDVRRFPGQTPGSPLLTLDGRVVGTPSYMSPEQASNRSDELGPRSDVYAIGALLYQLLTGRMPYVPPGVELAPAAVYGMLLAGPPTPVREIAPEAPDELVEVCEKAMAREPERRHRTPLDVAADIEAFLGHRPLPSRPPTIRHAARLFIERNRALATTIAVATVALIAIVAAAWIENSRKQREYERQFDLRSAQALAAAVAIDALLPAEESNVPHMSRWLERVDAVLAHAPEYRAQLASARATNRNDDIFDLDPAVTAMDRLEKELRPEIVDWRERAADLVRVSLVVDDRKWQEAIAEIAALPAYSGLKLEKQLGLVPLRRDPKSGLWEFWHVLSGERPVVDPADPDRWELTSATGIVLVLIPGGLAVLGTPDGEADQAPEEDEKQHTRDVAPFFFAKFEVTQAQWLRVMKSNPSLYQPGITMDMSEHEDVWASDDLHPVECVSWRDCARFVHRLGLEILDADTWEYACRAGTATAYFWGDSFECLQEKENVADESNADLDWAPAWLDDYPFHARVGMFEPNGFGLFDMHGNVSEWCANIYEANVVARHKRSGRSIEVRGGNWCSKYEKDRSAYRDWAPEDSSNATLGLRVSRPIRSSAGN